MCGLKLYTDGHQRRELVEFYDREHLENIVSLLYGAYAAVTFVCFREDNEPDPREREMLQTFIPRKFGAEVRFLEVEENSISAALTAFRALIAAGGFWHFDICGGSSVFVAAVGMLLAEDGGRRVALHEYDVFRGTCRLCYPRAAALPLRERAETLTVSQFMTLQEIRILEGGESMRERLEDPALRREIGRLWQVVKEDPKVWNNFCTAAAVFHPVDDRRVAVEKTIQREHFAPSLKLAHALRKAGILSDLREDGDRLAFCLNIRPREQMLYTKAGNLLELFTAQAVVDSGLCSDCCVGIRLDWEDQGRHLIQGPCNEVDVVAIRGHVPYFISCKNTTVNNEYLYEIATLTRHFGGAYAVPVMVSTRPAKQAVRDRAEEMGVRLIDGVQDKGADRFCADMTRVLSHDQ